MAQPMEGALLISQSFDVNELESIYERRAELRKSLLLFIRKNQDFLEYLHYRSKAERGYLRDLKDLDIVEACREIFSKAPTEKVWFPPIQIKAMTDAWEQEQGAS